MPFPVGSFSVSMLQSFDSGTRSSLEGSVDTRSFVTNPGYLTPPSAIDYFFEGGRGNLKHEDITRTDFSLNYKLPLWRGIELFVQPEVLNIFNEQAVTSFDEEIITNVDDSTLATFNPFTEQPIEGVHYKRGPNFGEPNSEGDYQTPRTFRFSVGLRF